jgi:hypothetical protein
VSSSNKRVVLFAIAILLCAPFVALVFIEGLASYGAAARTLVSRIAEEAHTEPDTLLGWINLPNVDKPDMYGKGVSLRTNAQRFRHIGPVAATAAPGHRRIVCSGDSFTLGYGVGDDQTWCGLLAGGDSTLETVNMGQGGYGIDQAYLWYLRDGIPLRPNIHVFAFITTDFERMRSNKFLGFPKPKLERARDSIRVTNVPVPGKGLGPAMLRWSNALQSLKTYQGLAKFFRVREVYPKSDSLTWEIARAAIRDMAKRDSAMGTQLVVVYLPTAADFFSPYSGDYRRWVHAAAQRGEFTLVDLIEPFRQVSGDSVPSMFLDGAAGGHYTVSGNVWVARELRRSIPGLSAPITTPSNPRKGN